MIDVRDALRNPPQAVRNLRTWLGWYRMRARTFVGPVVGPVADYLHAPAKYRRVVCLFRGHQRDTTWDLRLVRDADGLRYERTGRDFYYCQECGKAPL